MRLWSLHPKYLDSKGLVALWREALLAKHVLEGRTSGYRHHPQLHRFRELKDPVSGMNQYLAEVYKASLLRGYSFDGSKVGICRRKIVMTVTTCQLEFERAHLLQKLRRRDLDHFEALQAAGPVAHFAIFRVIDGPVAPWEKSGGAV